MNGQVEGKQRGWGWGWGDRDVGSGAGQVPEEDQSLLLIPLVRCQRPRTTETPLCMYKYTRCEGSAATKVVQHGGGMYRGVWRDQGTLCCFWTGTRTTSQRITSANVVE